MCHSGCATLVITQTIGDKLVADMCAQGPDNELVVPGRNGGEHYPRRGVLPSGRSKRRGNIIHQ